MNEIEKMMQNVGIDYEERYNNCTLNKEGECKLKCSCDIYANIRKKSIFTHYSTQRNS